MPWEKNVNRRATHKTEIATSTYQAHATNYLLNFLVCCVVLLFSEGAKVAGAKEDRDALTMQQPGDQAPRPYAFGVPRQEPKITTVGMNQTAKITVPSKRKADTSVSSLEAEEDILEVMPIGAGNEVGRSCIMMKFKGKHIMVGNIFPYCNPLTPLQLDCGIHPAYSGLSALPFFDSIDDPATIDLLLVSQLVLTKYAIIFF